MACSNCFNGCADIISDQCVKYTGVSILGIEPGDPLLVVENKITAKIVELMNGTGIIPTLTPADICGIVSSNIPCCPPVDLNEVLTALIKSICAIDVRLIAAEGKLTALNADYVIGCLSGVTVTSDTHEIVQAIIVKVCQVATDLALLKEEIPAKYVSKDELPVLVEDIISGQTTSTKFSSKMIPWVAIPYFGNDTGPGPSDGFSAQGVGFGAWENVYVCNGTSKTGIPDLRGRVIVGETTKTTGMDTTTMPGGMNPSYTLGGKQGFNGVILGVDNMPNHDHTATATVNDPGHVHTGQGSAADSGELNGTLPTLEDTVDGNPKYTTDSKVTGITVAVTMTKTGQGLPHANVQPGIGATMIMYIP